MLSDHPIYKNNEPPPRCGPVVQTMHLYIVKDYIPILIFNKGDFLLKQVHFVWIIP